MGTYFAKGRGWRYDFQLYGRRHVAPRGFRTKTLCQQAERALRDRLMAAAAGIAPIVSSGPSFVEWAGETYRYAVEREHLTDPKSLDRNLRKMLQFFGAPPADPDHHVDGAKYHGLTLDAPIRDGSWLLQFEEWMSAQQLAGSTKNHLRSAASKLYRVAMLPEYRSQTGITVNPFRGLLRDPPRRRTVVFTREQLRAVVLAAPPFLKLAIRIAALAPELRLSNIAALRWSHLDDRRQWIRMAEHKTARKLVRPLVAPVSDVLRGYLEAERQAQPRGCQSVVQREGQPVSGFVLQDALEAACAAAGVIYGQRQGGVTFHTIRHTARTVLAERNVSDAKAQAALGHASEQMSAWYRHLTPQHKIEPIAELAAALGPTLRDPRSQPRRKSHRSGRRKTGAA